MARVIAHLVALSVVALVSGCATSTPALPEVPRATSPIPQPLLSWGDARTSTVLSFDSPADAVFVRSISGSVSQVRGEVGTNSLSLTGNSPGVVIRLASLVRGRPFPGDWSAVGLRLRADASFGATLELRASGVTLASAQLTQTVAAQWNLLAVEVPDHVDPESVELALAIDSQQRNIEVAIDDLTLIANDRAIQTPVMSAIRKGPAWRIVGPTFETRLPSDIATESPMRLMEWSKIRMVFASTQSPPRWVSIDSLGRQIEASGGVVTYSYIGNQRDNSSWRLAMRSPGEVSVTQEQGRVDRQSVGDFNQDGFDESRNSYRVVANAKRLDITLTPGGVPLENAVIEIDGLQSANEISATLAGQIIRTIERTSSGTVLIEVPSRVERAVIIQVRSK
jgi:hypothetical protein